MTGRAQGRVTDIAKIPKDSHGKVPAEGPAVDGSPSVFVNREKALRVGDPGKHEKRCSGPNTWKAKAGSATVFINKLPAHRLGDEVKHCGGKGNLRTGSSTVFVGGPPTSGAAPAGADGTAAAGDPIDVVTGTMFTHPAQDFVLPGFFAFPWTRTYRSSNAETDRGLGYGWSHNHMWTAEVQPDSVLLRDPDGQSVVAPLPRRGRVESLAFGRRLARSGDLLLLDLGDGLLRFLSRDPNGIHRLTKLVDVSGNTAHVGWTDDVVTRVMDSAGRRASCKEEGRTITWTLYARAEGTDEAPTRTLAIYELDERGDLVRAVDARRRVTEYTYDEHHHLIAQKRADGLVYRFSYATFGASVRCVETWGEIPGRDVLAELGERPIDARGIHHVHMLYNDRKTCVLEALGGIHRYEGTAQGLVKQYLDPRGVKRSYAYDGNGNLTSFEDGAGKTARARFDRQGRPTANVDANGSEIKRRYEGGALSEVIGPDGAVWRRRLDERGRLVTVEDPKGGELRYDYGPRGERLRVTRPNGGAETMTYDRQGNLTSRTNAKGATATYAYDAFGIPVEITGPRGIVTKLVYDEGYNLVELQRSDKKTTRYELDALKRVVVEHHPAGGESRYRYVADALVEVVHPEGSRWTMRYDALLRPRAIVNPAGEEYTKEYDAKGNLVRETTFAGLVKAYDYDACDRIARLTHADGATTAFTRDAAGRVTHCEHSGGLTESYTYDAAGRLVGAALSSPAQSSSVEIVRDVLGNVVREVQSAGGWTFAVDYERDAEGRVVGRRYSTGWQVVIRRNAAGLPLVASVKSGHVSDGVQFGYDDASREIARWREGGAQRILTERNADGLPTRIGVEVSGEIARERRYTWSAQGPLARVVDREMGERAYTLDRAGHPLRVAGLGASESYVYSRQGTPLANDGRRYRSPLGRGGRPMTFDTSSFQWDARGRLAARVDPDPRATWRYAYDENDQLVSAARGDGVRVDYVYDALGRRLLETCDGVVTSFGWDGDSPVEEQRGTLAQTTRRMFADDGYTPLLEAVDGEEFRMIATDAAGTPWFYLDPSARRTADIDLTSMGKVALTRGEPGSLRFAGQRADAVTGLSYQRHRYYAPDLGVFMSPDPLGLKGSAQDIAFVPNATYGVDPLGLTTSIITVGQDGTGVFKATSAYTLADNPGASVVHVDSMDQLAPGSLSGVDKVYVLGHGEPGLTAGENGDQIAAGLKQAGFQGGPDSNVILISCNGGTNPMSSLDGPPQPSTAQLIANDTGATVLAPQADDAVKANWMHLDGAPDSTFWEPSNMSGDSLLGFDGKTTVIDGHWQTFTPK